MAADYEIAILLSSQLPDGQADEAVARYQKVMTDHGARIQKLDRWGVRKLAYDVRKQKQADYTFVRFCGEPDAVNELDRLCKLDESVLRHMIIRCDDEFVPEPEPEPEPEETASAEEEASASDEGADVEAVESEDDADHGDTGEDEEGEDDDAEEDEE